MKKKLTAITVILCAICLFITLCACQKSSEDLSSGSISSGDLPSGTVVIDESKQDPPDSDIDYSKAFVIDGTTLVGLTDYGRTLSKIVVPEGVTEIGMQAFFKCTNLTDIELPNGIISIGDFAFASCINLLNVNIPTSLQKIGGSIFEGCYSVVIRYEKTACDLEEISSEMPEGTAFFISLKGDEDYILAPIIYNCKTNLKANDGCIYVIANNGLQYALKDGIATVSGHANISGDIVIAERVIYKNVVYSVQGFDYYAFCYSTLTAGFSLPSSEIESIYLPDSITSIPPATFGRCNSLKSIRLPKSLTSIGLSAFAYCSNLTSIEIPSNVTSIGLSAFEGCRSLTIYCEAESQPSGWSSNWNIKDYSYYNGTYTYHSVVWNYKSSN